MMQKNSRWAYILLVLQLSATQCLAAVQIDAHTKSTPSDVTNNPLQTKTDAFSGPVPGPATSQGSNTQPPVPGASTAVGKNSDALEQQAVATQKSTGSKWGKITLGAVCFFGGAALGAAAGLFFASQEPEKEVIKDKEKRKSLKTTSIYGAQVLQNDD